MSGKWIINGWLVSDEVLNGTVEGHVYASVNIRLTGEQYYTISAVKRVICVSC